MAPGTGFWIAFVVTVALLAIALVSGLRGRRRLHLVAGPASLLSLAVAIALTEQLMRGYRFPAEKLAFHLWFAKAAALLALPVIVTGVWLWLAPAARRWHRVAVWVFAAATLTATGTGIWVFGYAEPR